MSVPEERLERERRRLLRDVGLRAQGTELDALEQAYNRIYGWMAEGAVHELRQTLTEMKIRLANADEVCCRERIARLEDHVEEAVGIVEGTLDRNEVARRCFRMDAETFDLAEEALNLLEATERTGAEHLDTRLEAARVEGEPRLLLPVIIRLVARFQEHRRGEERLVLRVGPREETVRVFVGLAPTGLDRSELMERMGTETRQDTPPLLGPYAQAVVEAHGGSVCAKGVDPDCVGYVLRLPRARDG